MSKTKNTNVAKSKLNGYLKLQTLNFAVYLIVFLLLCVVSLNADINKEYMLYISLAFVVISSFISGFISGVKERKNGILCGLVSPLPLNIILILLSLIFNGFKADLNILYTLIAGLMSGITGGIISVNMRLKR